MKKIIIFLFMPFQLLAQDQLKISVEKAHLWLINQMTPNKTVEFPISERKNFVLSYAADPKDPNYQYIFSKSNIYDNALAIIALSMLNDFSRAQKIIEAFMKSTSNHGRLWFNYNTHNSWPNERDNEGAIIRNGASAWFAYAITYYINRKVFFDPNYLNTNEAKENLTYLRKVTNAILQYQILDSKDSRYGFITGGEHRYVIKRNHKTQKDEEVFEKGKIPWASIEHNIDAYFLFRDAAKLLNDPELSKKGNILKQSLLEKAWNKKIQQFNRGHSVSGPDSVEALDAASWGSILLSAIGKKELAQIALKKSDSYLNHDKAFYGHKPYINMLIYEEAEINRWFYPDNPLMNWNELNLVWFEGTFGVITAKIKLGLIEESRKNLIELLSAQNADGTFPYATSRVTFQFTDAPSVASTAWFIMSAMSLTDEAIRKSFWGDD